MPSPYLFAALLVGLAVALLAPGRIDLPPVVFGAAQAITGVALGAYVRSSALSALAHSWLPVTLVSAATLGICLVAGALLARTTSLDPPTAALGSVPSAPTLGEVLAVPGGEFTVPPLLAQSAFALIGLQVGLRFTAATVLPWRSDRARTPLSSSPSRGCGCS